MSDTTAAVLQIGLLLLALALVYRPLGDYMARVLTSTTHNRVESGIYRVARVDPGADQKWTTYALSVLGFSAASILFLFALQRLQGVLPGSLDFPGVPADGAWNTAVSFVTNTNWQWYSGESTMGHLVQTAGLTVQNFLSAAVGIAVAFALLRGLTRSRTDRLGNFWVDLTRITLRVLLPIAVIGAILLLAAGVIQNFASPHEISTLSGGTQSIPGGAIASQEAIKDLGTNGGGPFNANSAHPFENPAAWTSLLEVFLLLVIPFSLARTFGKIVGSGRQGYAILTVMGVLFLGAVTAATWAEMAHPGTVPQSVGAAMEGKETRFGPAASALFGAATTGTSTGSVNSFHDSFTAAGGGVTLVNMLVGEISPGGTGTGLYGLLVLAVLTVFIAGLMVGRTPEYLGKKVGRREITLVSLYVLVMPTLVLVGSAITAGVGSLRDTSVLNPGPHGLSEILYAYASASNNNGSAFGGFTAATTYQNTALGICMLFGRLLPIILVLALAAAFGRQHPVQRGEAADKAAALPTYSPIFVGLLTFTAVVVTALTFFPALALAPLAEALL